MTKSPANPVLRVLGSYGLSCTLVLLLFLLTLLGTFAQVDHGLYAAQAKYFDSFFLWQRLGPLPLAVPLPGGLSVMCLLAVNLAVGGMVRMRKSWRTVGVMVVHVGIAFMLLAGAVKLGMSYEGQMTLYEGERCAEFESYHDWELAITRPLEDGRLQEYVIPQKDLVDVADEGALTFRHPDLPFDLQVSHYMRNCQPMPKGPMFDVPVPVVDGIFLRGRAPQKENELNIAGAYVTLVEKNSDQRQTGILWGWSGSPSSTSWRPWVTDVAGGQFAIELRHMRYALPFTIHLDKFTAKFHPGTRMASSFESRVTKVQGDVVQPVLIRMNEPLRDSGFVLFQSKYGPPQAPPGTPMYSVFAVVRNPSDQWPLIACIIIALGLLGHFGLKLILYISSEARRAAP